MQKIDWKLVTIHILRLSPAFLGLAFSLYYSRLMGLENRSFFTFILLSNTSLSFIFLSGLGFRIRGSKSIQEIKEIVPVYLVVSFAVSFAVTVLMLVILKFGAPYLKLSNGEPVPRNAILAIAVYSFLSALSIPFFDLVFVLQSLKTFLLIEVLVILSQISVFSLLTLTNQTTYFVSALLSFSLSYAFLVFSTFVLIISNSHYVISAKRSFRLLINQNLLETTSRSVAVNLIERFDKVLVPFFFVSPHLAQISVFAGLLGLFRVIPDTSIRLNQKKPSTEVHIERSVLIRSLFKTVVTISTLSLFANLIVYLALGPSWLLPLPAMVVLILYEFVVWEAKITFVGTSMKSINRIGSFGAVIVGLYLLILPVLMMNFRYEVALSCMSLFLILGLYFHKTRKRER